MKKTAISAILLAALALPLCACGAAHGAAEPQAAVPDGEQAAMLVTAGPEAGPERQNGERFEAVIILEGMEETVQYEHIRSDTLGFEMDYDYESFVRHSERKRERFVSQWDDPQAPENYLELSCSAQDAESVAATVREELSREYEITEESVALPRAGSCIRIDASEIKGGGYMPEMLQTVFIIPAPDGCRIAREHYAIEGSEGFGRRFHYMLQTLSVIARSEESVLTEEQALLAVQNYCLLSNPQLEEIVKTGDYPVSWGISPGGGDRIVIVYRSYTGSQNHFYIDPVSGETYVTEFVPGVMDQEQRTDESLNIWDYTD